MCSASRLTPAQGASPSCGWPPVVAAPDTARRSGRAGVSPSTREADLRIGGIEAERVVGVVFGQFDREVAVVVHQPWLLSSLCGITGRVRCSDLRERPRSTVVGRGHADGGIRSANYTHEVPGRSGVSARAEAGSAGPPRRLGTLPRSGRGDSCLDGADALMAAPRGLSPHRCRCGCGHWSSACLCGPGRRC